MQRHEDGTIVVSASDLVGFLECDHLVTLEQSRARGEIEKPFHFDPQLELLRKRGYAHEHAEIARLTAAGRTVVEMTLRDPKTPADLRAAEAETLAAMRAGTDVIFQATVFDGRWRGHPDFLVRRDDRPSALGSWSYDVADTKLASHVKASAILQMCVYADRIEQLQGTPPERLTVVTGDAGVHPHRYDDYAAYYRATKARFEARVFGPDADVAPATYPEPVGHCDICPWWTMCMDRRRADDHLSIVAGAAKVQRRRLVDAGVTTLTALAELPPETRIERLQPRILERLHRQAALQLDERRTHVPSYELIPPNPEDPGKGLSGLPEPSPLDVFFDLEADPLAIDGGLEYLFGWAEVVPGGEPDFHVIWAHDRAAEKAALEAFIDLVMERRARDPGMHVYHYGGYESGALKRLMQRHATREDEIDVLLRGRVLVNLYDHVVRQGIRASVESYSIKKLEVFYMPEREGGITNAGFSIVEYERWLDSGSPEILDAIAAYNRDDCISNLRLRDWLEARRIEALDEHPEWYPGGVVPRPGPVDGEPTPDLAAAQAETHAREDRLRADLPAAREDRTEDQQAAWLLAGLLDWHRREARPQWWDHFRLREASLEDLIADSSALGGLTFEQDLGRIARSARRRYSFDPAQETKVVEGKSYLDPHALTNVTVIAMDPLAGQVDLKLNPAAPHPVALIPGKPYSGEPMRSALGRLADDVIDRGVAAEGRFQAARDLLRRQPPRVAGVARGDALMPQGDQPTPTARRLAISLVETVLPIQGPPGTGKTWTAARMILDLVAAGRRVGVSAQSHRVISNLLEAIVAAGGKEGHAIRIGQRTDEGDGGVPGGVERIASTEAIPEGIRAGSWDVIGGTPWVWARPELESAVDVLFVDEAGQFSLANALAVAGACGSLVLLGDPNQLPQVSSGTHPEGAEASALEHLVGERRTIEPDRGLLLTTTYRLHPAVNAFISPAFYDGRLETDASTARQVLGPGEIVGGQGVRRVALRHEGARNKSREEADWVVGAIDALRDRVWRDRDGIERRLTVDDILVVAPYNAQVAEIARLGEERLGVRPNVGTVDKFQGREAPVAIYSMTTSTPDDAPRDLEFLYSGNRLNVAISRAMSLAILVASPALLLVACRTPEQMRLLNVLCRYVEIATLVDVGQGVGPPPTVGPRSPGDVAGPGTPMPLKLGL
ncbi:MAG: TM0106 family RecB-like putative nuclease [Chloroflexi bacterium]|nr:TM0106 family RecB-like putative nuclease [Chloroflexota bacterium]